MELTIRLRITPFWLSLLLHALILSLALLIVFREKPSNTQSEVAPIEIDSIREKPSAKREKQSFHPQSKSASVGSKMAPRSVTLGSLAMRMDYHSSTPQKAEDLYQPMPENRAGSDQVADDWDMLNPDPRIARFNQYIYNTVQGWLDRDRYLNHERPYGEVRVKIWFTKEGEWIENETVFDAPDPVFREIVLRALRKSFARPIPKPYLTKNTKFFIERRVILRD